MTIYVEYKLSTIQNSYNFKRSLLENRADSIEVLVLGHSHATYDYNPSYFSLKGYNLSNIGQSLFYDSKLTLKYVDEMPKLKMVIINVSYHTLGYELVDGIEGWRDYYYSQFWNVRFPEVKWHEAKNYSKTFLYTPKTTLDYIKKGFDVNLAEGYDRNGWLKMDTAGNFKNISDSLGKERIKFHNSEYLFKRVPENQRELELLVSELLKREIIPLIITPPVYATYYNNSDPEINKKNNEVIQSLCNKYNCMYFDYTRDNRFELRDFYDNDHLNFIGAEKFSKILNDEIIESGPLTSSVNYESK